MVDFNNHLWPAGVAAFVLHSFIVATLAFGMNSSPGTQQNTLKQDFCVEVAFMPEAAPEAAAIQEQDQQTPESRQMDKGLKTPHNPLKKIAPQTTFVRGTSTPLDAQKNLQQGFMAKGDVMPVHNPPPAYPREARRKKIQGVVVVRLSVTALGSIQKVTILPPRTDPTLEEAVLLALPHWRFTPGARVVDVPIEFRLKG